MGTVKKPAWTDKNRHITDIFSADSPSNCFRGGGSITPKIGFQCSVKQGIEAWRRRDYTSNLFLKLNEYT